MYSMFFVYVLLTIPKLAVYFGLIAFISILILVATAFYRVLEGPSDSLKRSAAKIFKIFIPVTLSCGLLAVIIPDKETSYAMAAAYVAQEAVQSELGQSAIKLLQANIDEALSKIGTKK